ncbi:MAG: tetratricopeptide repeat protein, partial [Lentisphaeria bacterium]|nr:tetratricopeptide repeat protein [Lentisphaeria bacterium]
KGENHPDTAASHYNIGLVYGMQGNYAKALEFFNKALEIRLKVLGENHPDIVASHGGIAGTLYRSGKKTEARDHLRKAAAIARKTLGPDHPTTKQISAVLQSVENELSK